MDNYQDSICLALEKALADESVAPINIPFWFLKAITQDFSDDQRIGSGGFGSVYKGALRNGMIAVQRLHNTIEVQEKDFQHEVACLEEVKHKNIVRFLGYCYETQHIRKLYQGEYIWEDKLHMLFCFEFLSNGSLANHVTGSSSGLSWGVRYQIIKGICEGVGYLHQRPTPIIHMDLKPDKILLDDSMVPRIADFGISRRFSENQSKWYMAPEFLGSGTISFKTDIYSLGVIIIEILMGCKERPTVDKVLESWTNTFGVSKSSKLLQQVKLCAELGIDCMHIDPSRRPHIHDIIHRLNEADISVQLAMFYQYCRQFKKACKPMRITASMEPELLPSWLISESTLLDVHPLELCFPFEANKVTQCSVNLINRTDCYFAYFIRPQFHDMYAISQPISYDLDPMSTIVLNMEMVEQEQPPSDVAMFEILMISMNSKRDLQTLESSIGKDPQKVDNDDLLKRVEELDGEVHAAMLLAVVCPQRDVAPKVISKVGFAKNIGTMHVHSTQPWILVGHGKLLSVWYYEMEATTVSSSDINDKASKLHRMVHGHACVTVRFIPRKEWCVVGDDRGYIHVYTCPMMDKIKRFKATGRGSVQSLAIHPTCPYLLSACQDGIIEIWDWEKDWACFQKVPSGSFLAYAKFNPIDADTFFTIYHNYGLKVWSIINPSAHQPIKIIEKSPLVFDDDHDHVFTEVAGRNHVVVLDISTGPQIWDLQTGTHVHTLSCEPKFLICTAAACHPTLPLIAIGGLMGFDDDAHPPAVYFWNSNNYRLEKTVRCTSNEPITYLGFVGSRRLVIGTKKGIEVLEIDMESLACQ